MAFRVHFIAGEHCDKCGMKDGGPMLEIATTGRYFDQKNLIFLHERCLQRSIESAKKRVRDNEKAGETEAKQV